MLPIDLLVTRVRRGGIRPVLVPMDFVHLELASTLIDVFRKGVGRAKGELMADVKRYERVGFDYRLIRGLATLLERRCSFEVRSPVDPRLVRRLVFEEAARLPVVAAEERARVLERVAGMLGVGVDDVERSLWSDFDEELILTGFDPIDPEALLKLYNLSLVQTLLFRSAVLEFTAEGNWGGIFRKIKWLGLMYSAEARPGGVYAVIDGPLSLFRMTDRYGTAVARLFPEIVRAGRWSIRADIALPTPDGRRRVLRLSLDSGSTQRLIAAEGLEPVREAFDSSVEESFYRRFKALGTGWRITREPGPLIAGNHVMIPDFKFEKGGVEVYMEIVGFWTAEYLRRKLEKLSRLAEIDMIVAVNKRHACSRDMEVAGDLILYDRKVPLKPVVDRLRAREEEVIAKQVEALRGMRPALRGAIVSLRGLAEKLGVLEEALRRALTEGGPRGYRLVGDELVSEAMLGDIARKIEALASSRLSDAIRLIEREGLKSPFHVLEALGYDVRWEGLDLDKSVIYKRDAAR